MAAGLRALRASMRVEKREHAQFCSRQIPAVAMFCVLCMMRWEAPAPCTCRVPAFGRDGARGAVPSHAWRVLVRERCRVRTGQPRRDSGERAACVCGSVCRMCGCACRVYVQCGVWRARAVVHGHHVHVRGVDTVDRRLVVIVQQAKKASHPRGALRAVNHARAKFSWRLPRSARRRATPS